MKQVIVINNALKMDKGKIARVCMMLGYFSHSIIVPKIPKVSLMKWYISNMKGVILKTDDYEFLLKYLDQNKINYKCHIDVGHTQVVSGSNCGVVFFCEDNKLPYIDSLKLL